MEPEGGHAGASEPPQLVARHPRAVEAVADPEGELDGRDRSRGDVQRVEDDHVVAVLAAPTDEMLVELAGRGVRRVAVMAPGFSADCLETLEEMALRGRETFLAAGGERFAYLPCLNDSPPGMELLRTLIARELEGWLPRV